MHKVNQFLLFCSGATLTILRKSPTEKNKYIGLGATILFTGILATIAAGYALSLLSNNLLIIVGISTIWGLMIFNLDRLIMSSIHRTGNLSTDILAVLPRILLAMIISLVIATPLELRLFKSEIEDELHLIHNQSYHASRKVVSLHFDSLTIKLNGEIKDLNTAILTKETQRNHLMALAQAEADGTGGSGKKNLGPIYQLKHENMKTVIKELTALRLQNNELIDQKRKEMQSIALEKEAAIRQIVKPQASGIAARMMALNNLSTKSNVVYWMKLFITLLFIIVETTPILLKLMMTRGPYDTIRKSMEEEISKRYNKA